MQLGGEGVEMWNGGCRRNAVRVRVLFERQKIKVRAAIRSLRGAASARDDNAKTVIPGGSAIPFCTLAKQTSRSHASNWTGMPASEETASTRTWSPRISSRMTLASDATSS